MSKGSRQPDLCARMENIPVIDTNTLKLARTTHDVLPLIRERWSARAFSDKPITDDMMRTLIEAASWAPSAMNEQPWRYRYALRGTEWFDLLWACLGPGNQPWAKNAAALGVCSGIKLLHRNNEPNHAWQHDVGLANAQLLLQATSMDIYCHLMGGFDHAKANATLAIDTAQEEIVCFIALGHLGHAEQLIEPFHTREITQRTRRPLEETIVVL